MKSLIINGSLTNGEINYQLSDTSLENGSWFIWLKSIIIQKDKGGEIEPIFISSNLVTDIRLKNYKKSFFQPCLAMFLTNENDFFQKDFDEIWFEVNNPNQRGLVVLQFNDQEDVLVSKKFNVHVQVVLKQLK